MPIFPREDKRMLNLLLFPLSSYSYDGAGPSKPPPPPSAPYPPSPPVFWDYSQRIEKYQPKGIVINQDATVIAGFDTDAGSEVVRIYRKQDQGLWAHASDLNVELGIQSADCIDISDDGNRIVVTGYGDSASTDGIWIFDYSNVTNAWSHSKTISHTQGEYTGSIVKMSGDGNIVLRYAARSPRHIDVFRESGAGFSQIDDISVVDTLDGNSVYLSSLSINYDGSLIAHVIDTTSSNHPHSKAVIHKMGDDSQFVALPSIRSEAEFDYITDVSLSNEMRIAVGAKYNDADGEDGPWKEEFSYGYLWHIDESARRGHARVFDYNGSAWVQVGDDIDGKTDNQQLGYRVDLSRDGTMLAVRSENFDSGKDRSVTIYEWKQDSWVQLGQKIYKARINDIALTKQTIVVAHDGVYPNDYLSIFNLHGVSSAAPPAASPAPSSPVSSITIPISHNNTSFSISKSAMKTAYNLAGCCRSKPNYNRCAIVHVDGGPSSGFTCDEAKDLFCQSDVDIEYEGCEMCYGTHSHDSGC